jgi:uncharacterized protein YneF (UPF0154 family)
MSLWIWAPLALAVFLLVPLFLGFFIRTDIEDVAIIHDGTTEEPRKES